MSQYETVNANNVHESVLSSAIFTLMLHFQGDE